MLAYIDSGASRFPASLQDGRVLVRSSRYGRRILQEIVPFDLSVAFVKGGLGICEVHSFGFKILGNGPRLVLCSAGTHLEYEQMFPVAHYK